MLCLLRKLVGRDQTNRGTVTTSDLCNFSLDLFPRRLR